MDRKHCCGCYNDDYNYGLGGASKCWSFDKKKKLVRKYVIPTDLRPPFGKHLIKRIPPCYTKQRYCTVLVDNIREDGYWRS